MAEKRTDPEQGAMEQTDWRNVHYWQKATKQRGFSTPPSEKKNPVKKINTKEEGVYQESSIRWAQQAGDVCGDRTDDQMKGFGKIQSENENPF